MAASTSSLSQRAPQTVRVKRHRDEPPIESLILGEIDDGVCDRTPKRQTQSRAASSEPLSEVDQLAFLFEQAKIVEEAMLQGQNAEKVQRPTLFKRVTTRAVVTPEERREQMQRRRPNPFNRLASTKLQASRDHRQSTFAQQRSIPAVQAVRASGATVPIDSPISSSPSSSNDVLIDTNWLRQKVSRSSIPIVRSAFKGASPDDFVVDVLERQEADPSPEEIEECAWHIPKFDLVLEEGEQGEDGVEDPDDPDLDGQEIDYPSDEREGWPEEVSDQGSDEGERWCTRPRDPDTNEYSFRSHDSFSDASECSGGEDQSFNEDDYHDNSDDREAWRQGATTLPFLV